MPKIISNLLWLFGFAITLNIFNSKSRTYQTTNETQNSFGFQDSDGNNAISAGDIENIEVLDGGAINASFDFAKESQSLLGETFASVLGYLESDNKNDRDVLNAVAVSAGKPSQESKIIPIGVMVASVGLLAYVVFKK